jgi:hypothetical protein
MERDLFQPKHQFGANQMLYHPPPLPWYALKVRTNGESKPQDALIAKDFETFLPTYIEVRRYFDSPEEGLYCALSGLSFPPLGRRTPAADPHNRRCRVDSSGLVASPVQSEKSRSK